MRAGHGPNERRQRTKQRAVPVLGGEGPCVREESCPLGQISMRKQLKISSPIGSIGIRQRFVVVVPLCGHFDGTVLFSFEIYSSRD